MDVQDILIDAENNPVITNGDFSIGVSDGQHINDIVWSAPGYWKESPLVGLNPYRYLNSKDSVQTLNNNLVNQLTMDGYIKIKSNISIVAGQIKGDISAKRK